MPNYKRGKEKNRMGSLERISRERAEREKIELSQAKQTEKERLEKQKLNPVLQPIHVVEKKQENAATPAPRIGFTAFRYWRKCFYCFAYRYFCRKLSKKRLPQFHHPPLLQPWELARLKYPTKTE